jgi:hypothetical protein
VQLSELFVTLSLAYKLRELLLDKLAIGVDLELLADLATLFCEGLGLGID